MTLAHLGSLRIKQERCQEALELFRSIIKIDPERVNAYASLGVVLVNLNRYEEALDNLNWVLSLDPNMKEAHSNQEKH